ncbi:MAG: DUF1049 domain-containing protein [Rhizobiales bacterium 32-66-8]|nr:MAG: DUF1049 domain-containing protein [Rhizobiales bacterium 32-66-8]
MQRFLSLLIGIPVCILVVALAVANRKMVTVSLDPFTPETPALALSAPLFAVVFASLIVGVLIGGLVVWSGQGRFRREARRSRSVMPQQQPSTAPALPAPVRRA